MADSVEFSAFSKRELGRLAKTFTLMGEEAVEQSRKVAFEIAELARDEIKAAGYSRTKSAGAVRKVVDGATVSRTSKTGRLSFGFANQRLSGGGNTRQIWGGLEFGAPGNKYLQFPRWSGAYGKGSRGWFIYPTLRKIQPELTLRYIKAMGQAVKEWPN
jgi:hypothetical protein